VSFRQFVRTRSYALGLGGFVRNLPDGTVEAELEGEARSIDELERAAREEHPRARIDRVDREFVPPRGSRPPVEIG
jgi:acylphosphatase